MTQSLAISDVRALLQLLGEVRELGEDPAAWRAHLAKELARLCNARAVVSGELGVRKPKTAAHERAVNGGTCEAAVTALAVGLSGISEGEERKFMADVFWYDHQSDSTLNGLMPLYGSTFVRSREELSANGSWYRSALANERFRRHDCDDFIMAMSAVPGASAICSLELFRAWGAPRFEERERLLVQLVHEELSRDFGARVAQQPRLSPRQRQVLALLRRGLAEKQIAAELDVSPHTVHDYVKALYRAHTVQSRAELLAKLAEPSPPLARLVATAGF
ncbi:MAG: LuxR family transcriptional regulator [Myxococcales bacterium]|nr:MAG: LuxR family transcriptional regulator [Myxococcales bacterium]